MEAYTHILIKVFDFLLGMFLALEFEHIKKWSLCFSVPVILLLVLKPVPLPFLYAWKVELLCFAVFLFFLTLEPLLEKADRTMKKLVWLSSYMYPVFLVHHILINYYGSFFVSEGIGSRAILFLLIADLSVIFLFAALLKTLSANVLKPITRRKQ